jgi:hypothetical protein
MNELTRQQLDAFPPGRLAEALAEFPALRSWMDLQENRDLAAKIEAADLALSDGLHDVSVPADLAERIKRSLAAPSESDLASATALAAEIDGQREHFFGESPSSIDAALQEPTISAQGEVATKSQVNSLESSPRPQRRWLLSLSVASAVAAALLLSVAVGQYFFFGIEPVQVSVEELGREALGWDANSQGHWNSELALAPGNYPASDKLNVRPIQWKRFATRYDARAVIYDMTPAGDRQVFLFAFRSSNLFPLGSEFSDSPIYSASGFSVGAYQANGLTYVLLVEGDQRRYQRIIKRALEVV